MMLVWVGMGWTTRAEMTVGGNKKSKINVRSLRYELSENPAAFQNGTPPTHDDKSENTTVTY